MYIGMSVGKFYVICWANGFEQILPPLPKTKVAIESVGY